MDVTLVDYLTGLPNMNYFMGLASEKKDKLAKQQQNAAILFFDLYGMRKFNNEYGFENGNLLLTSFAKLLTDLFGNSNCCRIGGDDFAAITEEDGIENKIHELLENCKALVKVEGQVVEVTVHVGVYLFKTEDVGINLACDRAKLACAPIRKSNESGHNYYDITISEENEKRQYIIDNLDKALKEHWITVYYQPIVRAVSRRVCDEEALARWIDPVKGFLSPADFIPILEEAKLIYKVDLYILEQVLEKMKFMASKDFYMISQSINLSRSDFEVCDIVEEICKRIDSSGVPRNKINIEITESILGQDFEFMKLQIDRFKKLGFSVWMDDFGSGYSSLDVLHQIQFDLIKFDMSFMRQLDKGKNAKIILAELMRMSSALGVDTVCEGVETEEQVQFLMEIGCSKIQGYYFQKPIPVEQILEKYEKGIQIGFENPDEAHYCETIGRINLHDLSVISQNEDGFNSFFSTLPMVIFETNETSVKFTRYNQSYHEFFERYYGISLQNEEIPIQTVMQGQGSSFIIVLRQATKEGKRLCSDVNLPDGSVAHYFIRKMAENPVTKTSAVVAAVLSIKDAGQGEIYANIAQALASDYFSLYYVNLETDEFIEYKSIASKEELSTERHGDDFFRRARLDALTHLYEEDVQAFIKVFSKENILKQIEETGTFVHVYRLVKFGIPYYVNMKAVQMTRNKKYLIIGLSNVDSQVKEQKLLAQARQNQLVYSRLMALSGDYLCIYVINPVDNSYIEFQGSTNFDSLGISKNGKDFFEDTQKNAEHAVAEEDREEFKRRHTKECIMKDIEKDGVFISSHHLLINDKPVKVALRCVLSKENGDDRLIMGIRKV